MTRVWRRPLRGGRRVHSAAVFAVDAVESNAARRDFDVIPLHAGLVAIVVVASFVLSSVLCALALRYAQRRLLDVPGRRRSHAVPTPRGGGIGIVVSVLFGLVALANLPTSGSLPLRLILALGLVAAIGWIDDHRALPVRIRLAVQVLAVGIWLWPLVVRLPSTVGMTWPEIPIGGALVGLLALLVIWSINLHNFMDGIDGLLTLQAVFVLGVLAGLSFYAGQPQHGLAITQWAAAVAGFLPYNFPRARLFLGDVGSYAIGLLIAVAAIWVTGAQGSAASALIAASAFVTDASCTLLARMLGGRRWHLAHREHLYQWLVRSGFSHAQVVACYMGWNLLVVLPLLVWLAKRPDPGLANWLTLGLYLAAVLVWLSAKRWCRLRVRSRRGRTDA